MTRSTRTTHPSTDLTRASTTATPERALAPDPREARRAFRAAEALGHCPTYRDRLAVIDAIHQVRLGGSAVVCGMTVEARLVGSCVMFRIASPWCGRRLSGRFSYEGPVVDRLLREQLLRGWLADE